MTKFKDFYVGTFATENDDNDSAIDKEVAFCYGWGQYDKSVRTTPWRTMHDHIDNGFLTPAVGNVKEGDFFSHGFTDAGTEIKNANMAEATLMIFDFDKGYDMAPVFETCKKYGLFAYVYTTWNHNKTSSKLTLNNFEKTKAKAADKNPVEVAKDYFSDKMAPDILDTIEISNEARREPDGKGSFVEYYLVTHAPIPKYRLVFVLDEPFEFIKVMSGVPQSKRVYEWKDLYTRVASFLGFLNICDQSCLNPGRIMYAPRYPEGTDLSGDIFDPEWKGHGVGVICGDTLDPDALLANDYLSNLSLPTGAGRSGGTKIEVKTKGLWQALKDPDFRIVDMIEDLAPDAVISSVPDKIQIKCPNDEKHSVEQHEREGGSAAFASQEGESWYIGCGTDTCKGHYGGDRALILDDLCAQHGIRDVSDYLSKASEAQPNAEIEGIIARIPQGDLTSEFVQEAIDVISQRPELEWSDWAQKLNERVGRKMSTEFKKHFKEARKRIYDETREVNKVKKREGYIYIHEAINISDMQDTVVTTLIEEQSDDPFLFVTPDFQSYNRIVKANPVYAKNIRNAAEFVDYVNTRAFVIKETKDGDEYDDHIEPRVLRAVFAHNRFQEELPVLSKVVDCPVFTVYGELNTTPGYHENSQTYFAPTLAFKEVTEKPTAEQVEDALDHLVFEVLRDYPFSDLVKNVDVTPIYTKEKDDDGFFLPNLERGSSSRLMALAMMLTPFVRDMIQGPTPLMHIDKPVAGTGASTLLNQIHYTVTGLPFPMDSFPTDDEEFTKKMLPVILEGKPIVAYDNIDHRAKIDSPFFAGCITAGRFEGRILGKSEIAKGEVRSVFMTTGNNIRSTKEILRRTAPVYLNAQEENPQNRTGIKHPNVATFALETRAKTVHALHILIQNWVAKGMSRYRHNQIGSFEEWSSILGGILKSTVDTLGGDALDMTDWLTIHYKYMATKMGDDGNDHGFLQWFYEAYDNLEWASSVTDIRASFIQGDNPSTMEFAVDNVELPDGKNLNKRLEKYLKSLEGQTFEIQDKDENPLKVVMTRNSNTRKWELRSANTGRPLAQEVG